MLESGDGWGVDPYGQYSSPYVGMGNNPVNRIDKDGGLTPDFVKTSAGEIKYSLILPPS